MRKNIIEKLTAKPSYLKWGDTRLADMFGCSPRTIKSIKNQLKEVKKEYLDSL